jgi:hypothetical protein
MDTNVAPSPFPGDPGHEGGSQPMRSLKGTCSGVYTQAPDLQEANTGSAVGSPSDTSGDISGWDSTTIASTGGAHGISSSGLYPTGKST